MEITDIKLDKKYLHPKHGPGEIIAADATISYLSICQKTSNLMDEHPDWLGQFVYDKAVALGRKITVTFFKVSEFYVEDLPYGADRIPQRFDKLADAREAGVNFVQAAELDCLIEVPTDFDGADSIGDKFYVPARYTVCNAPYYATAPTLRNDASRRLKGNLASGSYDLETWKRAEGSNSWFAPLLTAQGFSSQNLQDFISSRF